MKDGPKRRDLGLWAPGSREGVGHSKTVISNNQSPSSSQMSGWPWLKGVPAPEMPERASSYGFHSWQQSGVERNHEKEESRIGGGA